MGSFDYDKIKRLVDGMSVDTNSHSITYNMYPITSKNVFYVRGTQLVTAKANVDVLVKETGESATFSVDLLKLPYHGPTGFVINSKSKQVIDSYSKSFGWYINKPMGGFKIDTLQLASEQGKNLVIFERNYVLYVTTANKMSEHNLPLLVFLKAFTGESFKELGAKIGMNNIYVSTSVNQHEPLQADCVSEVLVKLFPEFHNGKKKDEFDSMGVKERFAYAYTRLFSPSYMILGDTTGVRMIRSISFKDRCKNLTLAKDVVTDYKTYSKGTILYPRVLDELDYLPVNELEVFDANHKVHVIRKNTIHNFRALGYTLEEDIVIHNGTLRKGTVLSVDNLRLLDSSERKIIAVSNGSFTGNISRELFTGMLTTSDIIGMVQVFLNTLGGLPLYHEPYDLTNQNLVTVEIKALSLIKSYCKSLNYELSNYVDNRDSGGDLLTKIAELRGFRINSLLDDISSVDNKESQQAELNNSIQWISKEKRASKNVKRSSSDMIGIQETQFGRFDPIESPESSKIGLVHTRTWLSEVDESGFLCAPFIPVVNGVPQGTDPVYLTAADQQDQYIAEWNETFTVKDENGNDIPAKTVIALCNDTIMEVPVSDVRYMEYSPYHTMSPARMQVPFSEHSNPKRILMTGNHHKQTIPVIMNERGIVSSGGDSLLQVGIIKARELLEGYYNDYASSIEESKESWCNRTLVLNRIDHPSGERVLYLNVEGVEGHSILCRIPFGLKASSGAMFSYRINDSTGCRYKGDDIVAHSFDVDIRKYDVKLHVDFGPMKVEDEVFDQAVALSRNFIVLYKTHESSTIDDAVVLNDRVVGMNLMTVMDLHMESYKLSEDFVDSEKGEREFEEFGYNGNLPYMRPEGIPKEGTVLKPGDLVISVKKTKQSLSVRDGIRNLDPSDKPIHLEGTVEGQVVESRISDNEAIVIIACIKPIETGDKIAGRCGNKGVIARIVPNHLMPFDPVTGMVPDIILNPQGVPSRSNISQILEANLGMAGYKTGQIHVISPYIGDTLEYVKNECAKADVKPTMMRDGRTGQYFKRPMLLGCAVILHLEHMVSHKMRAVGISNKIDPVFNTPEKGQGHAGGQAFGEYESWVLMGVGADKVLQDFMSVQSDDLSSIEDLKSAFSTDLKEIEVHGNNNNDQVMQVLFRSLGVEVTNDEGVFRYRPLTDAMIKGMSSTPIDLNNKDSLRSAQIFGATTNNRSKFANRVKWSWMPLHCELIHPFWLIKGKLDRYILMACPKSVKEPDKLVVQKITDKAMKGLLDCTRYIEPYNEEETIFIIREGKSDQHMTGMPALVRIFKNANLDDTIEYYNRKINNAKSSHTLLEHKKKLRGLLDFKEEGIMLKDFITTSLPVMPLSFRPPGMFKNAFQDFDYYYRRIIDEVVRYKSSIVKNPLGIYEIYKRIVSLCGLPGEPKTKENNKYEGIIEYFLKRDDSNKEHGKLRSKMLKKRILFSGRTVIIPSSDPKRLPTQIGVPFAMILTMFRPQLINLLFKNFDSCDVSKNQWNSILDVMDSNKNAFDNRVEDICKKLGKTATEVYDTVYSVISAYVEGVRDGNGSWAIYPRTVVAGRQPSLHKFSIRAYHPIITHNKCIEIHPTVAKGYNADYDGDQMWIAALVNDSACKQAMEKLSPEFGVISVKDNSVILEHSQDMRLGIYYATMLHNNVDDIQKDDRYNTIYHYNNLGRLSTDVDLNYISIHDLICYNNGDRKYLATAGRILFNALMPNGAGFSEKPFSNILGIKDINPDGYNDLLFDGLVAGKGDHGYVKIGDVTEWSYETFDSRTNISVIQAMSEFGFKYSDMSGISFLLEDLEQNPKMEEFISKAQEKAAVINKRYYQGAIDAETRKNALISLYSGMMEKATPQFIKGLDRNNNIFIMFDSGARGSEGQIMQSCGIIGVLQKAKGETLEVPVLSNYAKGNTSQETLLLSFSTRTGVASTQNETATAGEVTRMAVYMASGFKIVEEDCGGGPETYKVKYGDFKKVVLGPNGDKVDLSVLLDKVLDLNDTKALKYLKSFLGPKNEITEDALRNIISCKLQTVTTLDGVYSFKYNMDTLSKSLLFRREAVELPHLLNGTVISKKTLKHIEDSGIEEIKVRTMLTCKSIGGVCAKCYGWLYDKNKRPDIGSYIGIESAQSIGEPASQLTMSLFHQGGAAGASIDQGVDVLKKLLKGGLPDYRKGKDKVVSAVVPGVAGYLQYNAMDGNTVKVVQEGGDIKVVTVPTNVIVESGSYVEPLTPLTAGYVLPEDFLVNPTMEQIRYLQDTLLEMYYRTFESNNIKNLNARHFEVFVRVQTSLVNIIESDSEYFIEGKQYELTELLKHGSDNVSFAFSTVGGSAVIPHYSGHNTALAWEQLTNQLGEIVTTQQVSKGTSLISDMMAGQDTTGQTKKILRLPVELEIKHDETKQDFSFMQDFEATIFGELVQMQESNDVSVDIDFDDIFGIPDVKPNTSTTEIYNSMEEAVEDEQAVTIEEEVVEKASEKLNTMSAF